MTDITIGTAGHIDHGKTALVQALTGINTDRLSEEKKRGITIDIGFAHMIIDNYRVGFIDVPGHERFVKNMLSGIGGIRLLLLVVAADESVMPQTVEHLQICDLLGIPGGIIVITRTGLVEQEMAELVAEEARDLCRGTILENAPVVFVDSIQGKGIEELKSEISAQIRRLALDDRSRERKSRQVARLPIDRVFTLKGFGTVVTGTLLSGSLKQDDQVAAYPSSQSGEVFKIRSIEVFNEKEEQALTGQRTAVNLAGASKEELCRGMILSIPGKMEATVSIDAEVNIHAEAPSALEHRMPVRLHHGSGESIARAYLLEGKSIRPGEKGLVQLRLDSAILGFPGDRFILRRYSPATTIGGGIILQNKPARHRRKDLSHVIPSLQDLATALSNPNESPLGSILPFLLEGKGVAGANIAELSARTGETEQVIRSFLESLQPSILLSDDKAQVASRKPLEQAAETALEFLEAHHQKNPLSEGLPRQEFYERFFPGLPQPLFHKFLVELESRKLVTVRGAGVACHGCLPEMSDSHQEIRKRIESLFGGAFPGPESPGIKSILSLAELGKEGKDVFYHMLGSGNLIRINDDLIVTPEQIGNVVDTMRKAFSPGQTFQVAAFKDLFSLSRKHAIPLLEYLDQKGITRRSGNDRTLIGK